jgi:hypothetical protein
MRLSGGGRSSSMSGSPEWIIGSVRESKFLASLRVAHLENNWKMSWWLGRSVVAALVLKVWGKLKTPRWLWFDWFLRFDERPQMVTSVLPL